MQHAAIGLFDSGIGGSSIWCALQQELPQENTCYLADNAHAPYGDKSATEILALCEVNCRYLLARGCKLIIIACNTASAIAASHLRAHYPIPIIAIEPAIKPAALASKTGNIGVLATKATLAGEKFRANVAQYVEAQGIHMTARSGSGLVELIENNQLHSPAMTALLEQHCTAFQQANIDQLVLGCTHYPYLRPQLAERLPQVSIIDSGAAVARQTRRILSAANLLNPQNPQQTTHEWISTGSNAVLKQFIPQALNIHCHQITSLAIPKEISK